MFRRSRAVAASASLFAIVVGACACATRPRPTAGTVLRLANPHAIVEGRVRDVEGHAVSGVAVRGLPREKDLAWSPASVTDGEGRFRLDLVAPGEYGFLVSWKGITLVTARADDPARVLVRVDPGERRSGVEIVFHRAEWDRTLSAVESNHGE
ncbi:MAG TPA: carboxypeptidase-like regulatory domain-containing protein [Thermoanaerobaculia bacterium]